MPEGDTRNERPGSLRSAKSVCSETLIDSSQRVVNVGLSCHPRFGTMADSMDPRCETYETVRHGMEPIFSDFPGSLSFHKVSGRSRKSRFEHQEAGMMGYLRIA
jgi:hypothetical protein